MVDIKKDNDQLIVKFQVKTKDLNTDDSYSLVGWKNEGLWDLDVVELFLTRENSKGAYLELEISPLGQKVAILVKEARNDFEDYIPRSIEATSDLTADGFEANFNISLSDLPGSGMNVFGNAHACLGKLSRNYFSLFDCGKGKPDFHRPEYFQAVDNI